MVSNAFVGVVISLVASLAFHSCSHPKQSDVHLHSSAEQDSDYREVHDRFTRQVTVRKNFTIRYTLATTLLSASFRESLAKRYEHLFLDEPPLILETTARTGFFVTMYSPHPTGYYLDDDQLWTVVFTDSNQESHRPISIRRLSQKKRWQPFFTNVHQWSHEYLVIFDADSSALEVDFVEKTPMTLTISNADAQVRLTW